ncbi:bZIP transcription factor 11-like [Punica granatum]|uniref:BZIP domain-containing protein n=2 Tax=Punica granatum TaxID=22663 RepID=A0A218XUG6_PUNGR|nr:bZIP transcription factor 11-like [Punica granatum]OWM88805.1 hypothetical protein CDL15_Pgr020759 [Punica granatum]PKI72165.1 hypothetical protein CRG98_007434 [Punica granatum]
MASYSSASVSAKSQNSGSSGNSERQLTMEQRKRKRMVSNRESARRSRMRKQKHLNDLTAELASLRAENGKLMAAVGTTVQLYLTVEAENSVLQAQVAELTRRLESLDQIVGCINSVIYFPEEDDDIGGAGSIAVNNNSLWTDSFLATQPIMAPADILMY